MTFWNFYFQIFDKAVGKEETVQFLTHLRRHLAGPLLIIWDRLPAHRSRRAVDFVRQHGDQILVEHLPAYAPELNPVEYLWGHWKHHVTPECLPKGLLAIERWRPPHLTPPTPPNYPGRGLLETVFPI